MVGPCDNCDVQDLQPITKVDDWIRLWLQRTDINAEQIIIHSNESQQCPFLVLHLKLL